MRRRFFSFRAPGCSWIELWAIYGHNLLKLKGFYILNYSKRERNSITIYKLRSSKSCKKRSWNNKELREIKIGIAARNDSKYDRLQTLHIILCKAIVKSPPLIKEKGTLDSLLSKVDTLRLSDMAYSYVITDWMGTFTFTSTKKDCSVVEGRWMSTILPLSQKAVPNC